MRAYGTDHLRVDGDLLLISSRIPKGWQARVARTLTSPEHPGTAILWDDECYEVLAIEPLPQGYRYTLAPWSDSHAMRLTDRYDEPSEAARVAEHHRKIARERQRKTANLFGIFTGHLPAAVQNHLASELGILAARLTLISCIGTFFLVSATILYVVHLRTTFRQPPLWTLFVIYYFGIELTIRLAVSVFQNRPIGTIFGVIVSLFLPQSASDPLKGNAVPETIVPADAALQDLFVMRAPFITLLSAEEQASIARRFDYDYTRHATSVAVALLLLSVLGVFTSVSTLRHGVRFSAIASLLTAAAVAIEQVWRLSVLRTRPVGSFLAVLARPFVRRLL
jgi:hypothetical protein